MINFFDLCMCMAIVEHKLLVYITGIEEDENEDDMGVPDSIAKAPFDTLKFSNSDKDIESLFGLSLIEMAWIMCRESG